MTSNQTITLQVSYTATYEAQRAHKQLGYGELVGATIITQVNCTKSNKVLEAVKRQILEVGGVYQMREVLISA